MTPAEMIPFTPGDCPPPDTSTSRSSRLREFEPIIAFVDVDCMGPHPKDQGYLTTAVSGPQGPGGRMLADDLGLKPWSSLVAVAATPDSPFGNAPAPNGAAVTGLPARGGQPSSLRRLPASISVPRKNVAQAASRSRRLFLPVVRPSHHRRTGWTRRWRSIALIPPAAAPIGRVAGRSGVGTSGQNSSGPADPPSPPRWKPAGPWRAVPGPVQGAAGRGIVPR